MSPDICIVTPTAGRPECFSFLERWIREQSFAGKALWIVATTDDSGYTYKPLPKNIERIVIKVDRDDRNSMAANLYAACNFLESKEIESPVVFMEDDDYYHPDYLMYYSLRISEGVPIVGEALAKYYHVGKRRFRQLDNRGHASLAQTAIHHSLIPLVKKISKEYFDAKRPFIDLKLWKESPWPKHLHAPIGVHVSIKGMPGKAGYGIGHMEDMGTPDPWMEVFRLWGIPLDYALYMDPPIRFAKPVPEFGDPGNSRVSIGMVTRNHGAMARTAIESVLHTTAHLNPQIMLWDNASTEGEALRLLDEMEDRGVTVFRAVEGAGWIRSINHMARVSTAPYFVGLNNDVICHAGWCDALLAPFDDDDGLLGLTGFQPGYGVIDSNLVAHPYNGGEPDYLEGWCFCMPRLAAESFGPYDEYFLRGFYYDDVDLCFRLKTAGRRIKMIQPKLVDHLGNASLKSSEVEKEIMLSSYDHNKQVMVDRWSGESLAKLI